MEMLFMAKNYMFPELPNVLWETSGALSRKGAGRLWAGVPGRGELDEAVRMSRGRVSAPSLRQEL